MIPSYRFVQTAIDFGLSNIIRISGLLHSGMYHHQAAKETDMDEDDKDLPRGNAFNDDTLIRDMLDEDIEHLIESWGAVPEFAKVALLHLGEDATVADATKLWKSTSETLDATRQEFVNKTGNAEHLPTDWKKDNTTTRYIPDLLDGMINPKWYNEDIECEHQYPEHVMRARKEFGKSIDALYSLGYQACWESDQGVPCSRLGIFDNDGLGMDTISPVETSYDFYPTWKRLLDEWIDMDNRLKDGDTSIPTATGKPG